MVKILRIPRNISPFFRGLKKKLTETQLKHLRMIVLAFAISFERKNVATLKKIMPREAHHTNLSLFYRRPWDEAGVLDIVARRQLEQLKLKEGDTLYLIIDDTKARKKGKKMKGLHKIKDPATGRYFFGHTFLAAALYAKGALIPFRIKPWFDVKFCRKERRPFRKLTDLAVECIEALPRVPPGVKVVVLFDAYYACDKVFDACERRGFLFGTTLPANRNLYIKRKKYKAGKYARWLVAREGRAVRLGPEQARPFRKFRAVALDVVIQSGRPLRLVFSRRKNERKVLTLATNDFLSSASRIIDRYLYRWNIEVFFKDAKQLLGLAHYQCLDAGAITRHVHLTALAYALLTHMRLRADSEKGKRHSKLVSRDTTRKRQADLRNVVLEDCCKVFHLKAKRNKSLDNFISLLSAA